MSNITFIDSNGDEHPLETIDRATVSEIDPAWPAEKELRELYAVIFRDGGHRHAILRAKPAVEVDGFGMQPASLAAAGDLVLLHRTAIDEALTCARAIAERSTRDEDAEDVDALVRVLEAGLGDDAPVDLCGNCDAALPRGCGGLFKADGEHCRLNRAEVTS
jgi:hypothetical protein